MARFGDPLMLTLDFRGRVRYGTGVTTGRGATTGGQLGGGLAATGGRGQPFVGRYDVNRWVRGRPHAAPAVGA